MWVVDLWDIIRVTIYFAAEPEYKFLLLMCNTIRKWWRYFLFPKFTSGVRVSEQLSHVIGS